ncbi:hypothetical protein DFJ73DRAFT_856911 [Zopfochytrium polystomum]|nr:hypothetical protein DFJ73DRAFT_856911 [Zopfochytrium polystomum]
MPVTSWLEASWLGYHAVASTLIGLANITLPMAVLSSSISNRGGGSLPKLFETTLESVESAQAAELAAPSSPSAPTPASSSPYASAVSSHTQPSQNAQLAASLASDRLATARENLDTLAAMVAAALFQVQYAVGGDAVQTFLCIHARLVHKTLGLVKFCQYFVYFLHESITSEGIVLGPGTWINAFGLGLSLTASYWWGFRAVKPAKK